jgi:hypothetical protein
MKSIYQYVILGVDIITTSAFTALGLRAIASTIVLETVAILTEETVSPAKRKVTELVIKAIAFLTVAVIFLLLSIQVSLAGFVSSKDFLDTCSSEDEGHHIACSGYIGGVTDSYQNSGQFCIPPRTDPREITKFTRDYILRTRAIQREQPVSMVLYALKAKWPCITQGPNFQFQVPGFQFRRF